ncbi:MAG TPA: WXG100 family type VII secretion target [Ktedonobacterales bacterium]|nr:WXG100 family type VII secretion target [Ktedonobacterales bacterium]
MANSEMRVTPERLADAAVEFGNASREVLGLLGSLNATASNLSAEWSGRLGGSFDTLWDRWRDEIADLARAMETISGTLGDAAIAYARAEKQNISPTPPHG